MSGEDRDRMMVVSHPGSPAGCGYIRRGLGVRPSWEVQPREEDNDEQRARVRVGLGAVGRPASRRSPRLLVYDVMSGTVGLGRSRLMSRTASLYLAQIRPGRVEIYRDDSTRVDAFDVPVGARLRAVLADHGWRPTGRRVSGRGWDVIIVEPIPNHNAS